MAATSGLVRSPACSVGRPSVRSRNGCGKSTKPSPAATSANSGGLPLRRWRRRAVARRPSVRGGALRRGITGNGQKGLLHLAPGTKEGYRELHSVFQDFTRRGLPAPLLAITDHRRPAGPHPRRRDVLSSSTPPAVSGQSPAESAEQGPRRPVARARGARPGLVTRRPRPRWCSCSATKSSTNTSGSCPRR